MPLIGLTGGIASGKSTVARMLASRGALIVDADEIAHSILLKDGAAYEAVIARFGPGILDEERNIDRSKLAAIVFADPEALRDHEAITHPEIYRQIVSQIEAGRATHDLVVLDAALLVETLPDRGRDLGLDALVVVAGEVDDQVARMIRDRGMSETDARSRVSAQAPMVKKLAAADYVLDNRGSLEDLEASVEVLWNDLMQRFPS